VLVAQLTRRELQVVAVYARTGSTKLTAAQLGLAPGTVAVHLANARKRKGVDTTVQLVVQVIRQGELEP
jgi:DNA-binding CsgD family transcriptional regulator